MLAFLNHLQLVANNPFFCILIWDIHFKILNSIFFEMSLFAKLTSNCCNAIALSGYKAAAGVILLSSTRPDL